MLVECVAGTYEHIVFGVKTGRVDGADEVQEMVPFLSTEALSGSIRCIATNGRVLVCGTSDDQIRVMSLKKKCEIGVVDHHKSSINAIQLMQNKIISAAEDGSVGLFRMSDWNCIAQNNVPTRFGAITSIAVHASEKLAFLITKRNYLLVWDLVQFKLAASHNIRIKTSLSDLFWIDDEHRQFGIVSGRQVLVYDTQTCKQQSKIDCSSSILVAVACTITKETKIITGSQDGCVRIWFHDAGKEAYVMQYEGRELGARIRAVDAVSCKDQVFIGAGTSSGQLTVWTLQAEGLMRVASYESGMRITCLKVHAHGSTKRKQEKLTKDTTVGE